MHAARADWEVATRDIAGSAYLTKLRTDLGARFLDQDILLRAAPGGDVTTNILVDREINRPPPPPPCSTVCTTPRSGGGTVVGWPGSTTGFRSGGGGDGLCSVIPGREGTSVALGAVCAAAIALLVARRRRR